MRAALMAALAAPTLACASPIDTSHLTPDQRAALAAAILQGMAARPHYYIPMQPVPYIYAPTRPVACYDVGGYVQCQ